MSGSRDQRGHGINVDTETKEWPDFRTFIIINAEHGCLVALMPSFSVVQFFSQQYMYSLTQSLTHSVTQSLSDYTAAACVTQTESGRLV